MALLHRLNIGHRIYFLVITLLIFIGVIGGVGVYKMNVIGHEMEEIALRDIPLTQILEKITVHQLEQAILMEKALRFKGVSAHAEGETFDGLVKHFEKLAKKTDQEILEAEAMAEQMIQETRSKKAAKEFTHVLEELKKIEQEHKEYEHHVFEIFKNLKQKSYTELNYSSGLDAKVIQTEEEQENLDHHIESLLSEVSNFTKTSMDKALENEKRGKALITALSIGIFSLGLVLAYILARSITRPLGNLTHAMTELADGKLDTPIPDVQYKDEINAMATAMQVFQDNMLRAKKLEQEQEETKRKQQQRQNELKQLVGIFGSTIGAVFSQILDSSNNMVSQAQNMMQQSQNSQEMATSVATEAEESAANANSLSAATEEMVASIREISKQVTQSSEVTRQAVEFSSTSQKQVQELQQISNEIGEVVALITDIAEQTNLLALNATIEAARAGEAGKGFAVVANEVKSLASQTGKATDEISAKIQAIQNASGQSANSIAQIGTIINNIDQYITAIVAAIEEQNSTTEEIARNVQFVSESSGRVSENVQNIQTQSSEVGQSSQIVSESSNHMSSEAQTLSKEVDIFLSAMQSTNIEDDTYEPRPIQKSAHADVNGAEWSGQVQEISCAHCVVSPAMTQEAGTKLNITIDGIDAPLSARIAKSEDGRTAIQFPLDLGHMDEMKNHINKLIL